MKSAKTLNKTKECVKQDEENHKSDVTDMNYKKTKKKNIQR